MVETNIGVKIHKADKKGLLKFLSVVGDWSRMGRDRSGDYHVPYNEELHTDLEWNVPPWEQNWAVDVSPKRSQYVLITTDIQYSFPHAYAITNLVNVIRDYGDFIITGDNNLQSCADVYNLFNRDHHAINSTEQTAS